MFAQKNHPLTPFIANEIIKMKERGITSLLSKRHSIVPEPKCKGNAKGQPLGMDKFASLFIFYSIGCTISLIIVVMENIFKPSRKLQFNCQSSNEVTVLDLKKTSITKALHELDNYSNDQDLQVILMKIEQLLESC